MVIETLWIVRESVRVIRKTLEMENIILDRDPGICMFNSCGNHYSNFEEEA
jgi:hypothetical protein